MAKWVRFSANGQTRLGTLDGDNINLCGDDLFADPAPTGEQAALSEVELLAPFTPNSILALWNNFHERAAAEGQTIPVNPLYFAKPVTSVTGPDQLIRRPRGYRGDLVLDADRTGQFINAFLSDHGGIHVGEQDFFSAAFPRLGDDVHRLIFQDLPAPVCQGIAVSGAMHIEVTGNLRG